MPKGVFKRSEAIRKQRSIKQKEIGRSPKFTFKGGHHSEATKEKISKAATERNLSPELRKRVSEKLTGRRHSEERRKKIRGEKCHFWKGGITPLRRLVRHLSEYSQWRSDVFQRDNWRCQTCGARSQRGEAVYLEAHHKNEFAKIIKENKITSVIEAQMCKELWDVDNGVTLCNRCHNLTKRIHRG